MVCSLAWEDPLYEEMATHSIFLLGKSHGQRSLVGYSPWGYKESDMTKWLSTHESLSKLHHLLQIIHSCASDYFLLLSTK